MSKGSELRRTSTRHYLLMELRLRGRRSFSGRYTLSLRIMEEHGYVGRNCDPNPRTTKWHAKQMGLAALERWEA